MLEKIANTATRLFEKLTNAGGNHMTPAVVLSIDGQAFGTQTMSRIIDVTLDDKRGFEADELTITLSDYDGALAIPSTDSMVKVWLGYVETGVVYKGEYKITGFEHSGAPDQLRISAVAADMAAGLTEQQEKTWSKTTLGAIVETIAKKYSYTPKVHKDLAKISIDHMTQTNESDASFLMRLADQNDAIATIKQQHMLFMPAGQGQTLSGEAIPTVNITRLTGDQHRFTYNTADNFNAVKAYYQPDKKGSARQHVIINADNLEPKKQDKKKTKDKAKAEKTETPINSDGEKTKTLRHLYASKATAERGARAAYKKLKRGRAVFSISLAVGRPDLAPETPIEVTGFKPEIDAETWIVAKVSHSVSDGGYVSGLELEALLKLE
ncbi:late control protein [Vitreoscilla massiliensis]|uniref:Late control protein n=1 Tax=Vitreoscilla massiliensis TaxID=1689272 RepID=A0ABY4E4G9_9NEIS|nr:contractile injection system protein, VgrG/Pvc8 family [Vitreoscilla massiliensis]UOO90276.1 late control protein [Vitreoscilla massiliensis]